tara:strand:+ start:4074 stop:4316 length:243 start_codon:yes stop_codon:yes gene_type:complete
MKNKIFFLFITALVNSLIIFSEEFNQLTFLILFNTLLIYIFILVIKFEDKNKHKIEKSLSVDSAEDHPIIVSARKRLKKD